MALPRVSVCIPTYNQGDYIEETIRSAADQSWQPAEIIVSDNCSTDATPQILERLAAELPLLTVVRNSENIGMTRNTDQVLRRATGDFLLKLDSDDYLLPGYIESLASALADNPSAGYSHCAVQEVDEAGGKLKERRLARLGGYQSGDAALRAAARGYRVAANIVMFRREAFERIGYVNATEDFADDYFTAAKIADAGLGNVYVDKVLCCYRVWADTAGVRQRRKLAEIVGVRHVFERVLEPGFSRRGWSDQQLRRERRRFACRQAYSLGWGTFSHDEKKELEQALLTMSPTLQVRAYCWLYRRGFGAGVARYDHVAAAPKRLAHRAFQLIRTA